MFVRKIFYLSYEEEKNIAHMFISGKFPDYIVVIVIFMVMFMFIVMVQMCQEVSW